MRASLVLKTFSFAVVAVCALAASTAKAEITVNEKVPLSFFAIVDCDQDFVPEDILVGEGLLHIKMSATIDNAGQFHGTTHFNPINLESVGLMTGDTYRGVGLTRETVKFNGTTEVITSLNNFYQIGQNGIVYLVKGRIHLTFVDGEPKAVIVIEEITCPK